MNQPQQFRFEASSGNRDLVFELQNNLLYGIVSHMALVLAAANCFV